MARPPAPGPLAFVQSLVNTLDVEAGTDALDTVEGRAAFGVSEGKAEGARELREALRAACLAHAGHAPHAEAAALGELLARAPLVTTVDPADGSARLAPADPGSLAARVAVAVALGSLDGSWQRLKVCEDETCRWAYYDRSPAGRGRWCAMEVCGARAKMRAYRARRAGE
ncbi:CGNR zinc finger domain-containing protein [Streptomyces sp. NPDC058373]|uniref:CGNR zinc finger domain-containing protein n=1 Tax=Streptomyces sp. NPDC058373 TaxID=3346465 RepID=UPI0036534944